jgi:tight adherence protein B
VVALFVLLALLAGPSTAQEALTVNVTSVGLDDYPLLSALVQIGGAASQSEGPLDQGAFAIDVDGTAITEFTVTPTNAEPVPTATLLLIDESGSMKGAPTEEARAAARRYIEAMRPVDQVAIYAFNEDWRLLHEFSSDKASLSTALDGLNPGRETALYEGVGRSVQALTSVPDVGSKYLVVLSDGGDTASTSTLDNAMGAVRASGVQLYAVGLKGDEFDPTPLVQMAEASGGRYLEAPTPAALTSLYESLAREIQNQYVIDVEVPPEAEKGAAGVVTVGVTVGDATAQGERGFFYPERGTSEPAEDAIDPGDTAVTAPIVPIVPTHTLMDRVVSWSGSDIGVALLAAALLVGAFLVIHRALFPKRDILSEYSDILENRRSLAPMDPSEEKPGRFSSAVGRLLALRGFESALQTRIEDAGWKLRSSEFFTIQVGLVAVVSIVLTLLDLPTWFTVLVMAMVIILPLLYLDLKAKGSRTEFEAQIPDALVMMANALRAGQGFDQSVRVVAEEGPDPIAHEFDRVLAQQRLGVPPEETLRTLSERMQSEAFDWVVLATTIQREVGGNLAEIYDNIADTLRQRAMLRGEIRTLTAEGRISAFILILLPFVVAGIMLLLNPEYLELLYTTRAGIIMIIGSFVAMLVGVLWLRRIINFEV